MPRANPAAKKGHHTNRHDNGLVGPGKRVSKQKSNGQLNTGVKPSATPDEPLPTSPATELPDHVAAVTGADYDNLADTCAEGLRWRKRGSESSSDGQEHRWEGANGSMTATSMKRPDVPAKARSTHDLSAMQIASTILTSNPAGDTISLLIVLLALPSMVLTIVQALFASLTLMPPSTGVSPASFLSLFDVFQGSAGSPSLGTMAVVDVICFAAWVCLWSWAQNFALDLAQIQIAITLGSGNAGNSGSVNTICFLLVLMVHSARSSGLRHFVHTKLFPDSIISHPRVAPYTRYLPTDGDFGYGPGTPSKLGSLFAVHIISQALMAFVRRRVAGTSTTTKTKRLETEIPTTLNTALDSSAQDSVFNTAASPGPDGVPPPTPTLKDNKDKALTAKKRRRQANQVRSRQPFWAALASTKVHVLREVEHTKAKSGPTPTQDTHRGELNECIWITNVEPSVISFEAGHGGLSEPGFDARSTVSMKPFYVRINNARWHHVHMDFEDEDVREDSFPTRWTGSIGGLAPDCNYICSFRRIEDEKEMATVMVRTPPMMDRDQLSTATAVPARQSARPNSPTTTLKTSIQTAERSREDAHNRRNRIRKNHRGALAKLDREIEQLQNRLKSGGDDHKQRQKLLQAQRNAQQHEEAIGIITNQLDELETIPEEETVEYDSRKAVYDERNRHLSAATDALADAKSETNQDFTSIKSDLTNTMTRKERLIARNSKLVAEQERLTQANIQNMSEKERKALESTARAKEQDRQTADWQRRINDLIAQLNSVKVQSQGVFGEIEEAMIQNNTGPLTPEGELPGTHRDFKRSLLFQSVQAPAFIPDPNASPFQSFANPVSASMGRPRSGTNQSTGGISAMSGDFDDYDPIPPMQNNHDFEVGFTINGRKGSGSSRGVNNHSPANVGVIGGAMRSPQRGSNSPGSGMQSTNTW